MCNHTQRSVKTICLKWYTHIPGCELAQNSQLKFDKKNNQEYNKGFFVYQVLLQLIWPQCLARTPLLKITVAIPKQRELHYSMMNQFNIHMHLYTNIVLHVICRGCCHLQSRHQAYLFRLAKQFVWSQECKCVTSLKEPLQK